MRPWVAVTAVSLCLWCGIAWLAIAATNQLAPGFLHAAKNKVNASIAKVETRVQLAFYRTIWRDPA